MENNQGKKLLELLFNKGEEVYASPDKYSSRKNKITGEWEVYRPSVKVKDVDLNKTVLIGINPIKGSTRSDDNVTAFRSFLVEMDGMDLKDQLAYIKAIGMPYTACVFSGNKSLHFAVTLEKDLPDIESYRFFANWLLKAVSKADQATKNPSRAIRFAGVNRPQGKKQILVETKERVSLERLQHFLSRFPEAKPVIKYEEKNKNLPKNDFFSISKWVRVGLQNGFDFSIGRNNRWFSVGVDFGKAGFDIESTVNLLEPYFSPEPTFGHGEWLTAIKSGWSKGKKNS